jgi:hypothetical protein
MPVITAHRWSLEEMTLNKRNLPCGCCLSWDEEDAIIALCIRHSIEYNLWKKSKTEIKSGWDEQYSSEDDNEFFKMIIIASQKKRLKSFDKEVLLGMQ